MCVCVYFGIYVLDIFLVERCFWEVKMLFGSFIVFNKWVWVEWFMISLICSFVFCGFVTNCQRERLLGHIWFMLGTYVNIDLANPLTKHTLLVIGSMCLTFFLLRDDFESLKCCLDLWLSSMFDCIHVCVFLFFKKLYLSNLNSFLTPLDS